ncbi:MAG: SOS response-associated peptidase [Planctomycetes bacterium]|nr:SOS response-associated peptidase [Planctomycetota bacterium]
MRPCYLGPVCGRFTLRKPKADLLRARGLQEDDLTPSALAILQPRHNIAPSQDILAVRLRGEREQLDGLRWGLVPRWAKERSIGNRMINARAETVGERPSFRDAFKHRRCLVPVDGYFEWQKVEGGKQPWFFHRPNEELMFFAGLWEEHEEDGDCLRSCTLLTTAANNTVSVLHHRMPVLLDPKGQDHWMDPNTDREELTSLLNSSPEDYLNNRPVSKRVNRPMEGGPELLEAIDLNQKSN